MNVDAVDALVELRIALKFFIYSDVALAIVASRWIYNLIGALGHTITLGWVERGELDPPATDEYQPSYWQRIKAIWEVMAERKADYNRWHLANGLWSSSEDLG